MKYYTVIYGESNMQYSFKAENEFEALEFCKGKFSTPTSQMVIVENTENAPCECGRVVFANNKFLRYE